MSDMWEAGCDPFENGYDPKAAERLYRERITGLMAECEGWRHRHVRSAARAADLATEVEWLRKETTRLSEEWSKGKRRIDHLEAQNESYFIALYEITRLVPGQGHEGVGEIARGAIEREPPQFAQPENTTFPNEGQGPNGGHITTPQTGGEHVLVPREPTEAMLQAGYANCKGSGNIRGVYRAMLEAALLSPSHNREKAEIERLRAALEPFAKVVPSDLIGGKLSSVWLWEALVNVRAALASPSSKTGEE